MYLYIGNLSLLKYLYYLPFLLVMNAILMTFTVGRVRVAKIRISGSS